MSFSMPSRALQTPSARSSSARSVRTRGDLTWG